MINSIHGNNTAYDGFESNFSDRCEILNYRKSKIKSVYRKINFVKKLFNKKINVLDVGSGNSKFLYGLNELGILNKGYGVEISKSRHEFAEKWLTDLGINNVENINSNFFDINLKNLPNFDLIYCSDLVFQFFEPTSEGNDIKFLNSVYEKMSDGSIILLELDTYDRILASMVNNKSKLWNEFGKNDPWRYLLWDCEYDNKCMTFNKTFIKRDLSEISNSLTVERRYDRKESEKILKRCKFNNIKLFEYWENEFDMENDEYIIIGKK